jgi:hypothetical protein
MMKGNKTTRGYKKVAKKNKGDGDEEDAIEIIGVQCYLH